MKEEWRDIKGWEGVYQISNSGNLKSLKFGKERILKKRYDAYGYVMYSLNKDGKSYQRKAHRLVLESFGEKIRGKEHVNHKNGVKGDNRIENLEWCTHSENIQHAFDVGLAKGMKGEKHPQCKLTKEQVVQIRNMYKPGKVSQEAVAKLFGVDRKVVSDIYLGKSWSHL